MFGKLFHRSVEPKETVTFFESPDQANRRIEQERAARVKEYLTEMYIHPSKKPPYGEFDFSKDQEPLEVVTRSELLQKLIDINTANNLKFKEMIPKFKIEQSAFDFKWTVSTGFFRRQLNIGQGVIDALQRNGYLYNLKTDIEILDQSIKDALVYPNTVTIQDILVHVQWCPVKGLNKYDSQVDAKKALDIYSKLHDNDGSVIQYYDFPPLKKAKNEKRTD